MTPTEEEWTLATHACARLLYGETRKPVWDDLVPADRRTYLEAVLPWVSASLQAVPDRGAQQLERVGSYVLDDGAMWCHHQGCTHLAGKCSCGLERLLDQLSEVEVL